MKEGFDYTVVAALWRGQLISDTGASVTINWEKGKLHFPIKTWHWRLEQGVCACLRLCLRIWRLEEGVCVCLCLCLRICDGEGGRRRRKKDYHASLSDDVNM